MRGRSGAADLVKVLALGPGHRMPRDGVLETLWPKLGAGAAASNLHEAASYPRDALGDRDAIVLRGGVVALAAAAEVTVDVERFERGSDSATRAGVAGAGRPRRRARRASRRTAADQRHRPSTDYWRTTMTTMAVTAKKLDVKIGDVVEIEGRRYDASPTRKAASRWSRRSRRRWRSCGPSAAAERSPKRSSTSCSGIFPATARGNPWRQVAGGHRACRC